MEVSTNTVFTAVVRSSACRRRDRSSLDFVRAILLAVSFVLCAVLCAGPAAAQAGAGEVFSVAPLNPAFLDYLQNMTTQATGEVAAQDHALGLIPEPMDFSYLRGQHIVQGKALLALPASYDLRTLGRLTPIKDQGNCGSCWAFTTFGSLESYLLPTETWDFSENNLKNTHGFDPGCCDGGNRSMSTAYLARWGGPVSEACDPYDSQDCASPSGCAVLKHVQEVIFVPGRSSASDNDNIKQAVMTYGAVFTSYYHDNAYYNPTTYAYYYDATASTNHVVNIVGWDDNYDKSNFVATPPGNGAFIIRNSWGSTWGDRGYFHISYYDSNIGDYNAVFKAAEPASNYRRVYQYDPLGWVLSLGFDSPVPNIGWFANVFTAETDEQLAAVSWYTASPNSSYQLYVYRDPTSGPRTGILATSKSGTVTNAGYQTFALNSAVTLTAGHKFSVVVKLTTPGLNYPIPVEYPVPGYSSGAVSHSNESYVSPDGTTWFDLATTDIENTNVCLKAFTRSLMVTDVSSVLVPEGSTATFNVKLNVQPTGSVVVSASRYSGDTDITVQSGSSLTFTTSNWSTYQTVTLAAAQDADALDSTATIRCSAPGWGIADVIASEIDAGNQILTDANCLSVPEGGTASLRVKLGGQPAGNLVVSVSRYSGDTDITVRSGSSLTFTASNWNSYQKVTLAAAQDADTACGVATIRCSAAGLTTKDVTATERDDDVFHQAHPKGWVLLSYDMDYLREIIKKAPEYGVTTIQISHDIMMNTWEVLEQEQRRKDINELIDLAHANGVTEVALWTHEVCSHNMPAELKAPAGHPAEGHADGNNPAMWAWIRDRYAALLSPCTGCPNADSIVLTFSEVEDNVYQHEGDGNPGLPPGTDWEFKHDGYTQQESVAMLINNVQQVCAAFGKRLYARTWGSSGNKWEQPIIKDGILLNGDTAVWMMNKNVGGVDWPHADTYQPLIGTLPPEFNELIEFDLGFEYYGRGVTTGCMTSYLKDHWNYDLDRNVDGAVARIDRESNMAYYKSNRLNLYAFKEVLANRSVDPAAVNLAWCRQYFPWDIAQDIADHYDAPGSPWEGDTRYMMWEAYFPRECPINNAQALEIAYAAIPRIHAHKAVLEGQTTLNTREGKNDFETLWSGITTAITMLGGIVPDWDAPSVPANVVAIALSSRAVGLSWTASTDNVGVTGYRIYRNGNLVGTSSSTSYTDGGLQPVTTYSYRISALDAVGNESAQSSPPATVTTRIADNQPPSMPTKVVATPDSPTQITVTWKASTDNIGVAGYNVFRNGALAGISPTTSYSDTGLFPNTAYYYTVSAYDADGNESAQSAPAAQAKTPSDTTAPSVPDNLVATGISLTAISLTWTPSGDDVGVVGYRIYRNGVYVTRSVTPSYVDIGLMTNTAYVYRVAAYDAAGNISAKSSQATGTTMSGYKQWLWEADNHTGVSGSYTSMWTDDTHVFTETRNSGDWYWDWDDPDPSNVSLIGPGTSSGRSWLESDSFGEEWSADIGVTVAARVRPLDMEGNGNIMLSINNSSTSNLASAEDPTGESTHVWAGWDQDGADDMVVFASRSGSEIRRFPSSVQYRGTWCIWTLSGKQIGSTMAWDVWINGVHQGADQEASDGTLHTLVWSKNTDEGTSVVIGQRKSQNSSHDTIWDYVAVTNCGVIPGWDGAASTSLTDTESPSVPTNVQAMPISSGSINLTWTPSTDNWAVVGYRIYRDGIWIGTSALASYMDMGLLSATAYSYAVAAFDAAGNVSAQSSPPVVAATWDTTLPSIPTNVTATALSMTSIRVAWTASTDNVGVAGYNIYRNGVYLGASAMTAYVDNGLLPGTKYSYNVSAYDAAGNVSAQSWPQATATTNTDSVAPSVPKNVLATAQPANSIGVTWTASTDNIGVAGYKIYRNGSQVGTSAVTSYTDSGLLSNTTYSYTVSAYDGSGNSSAQSSPAATATTYDGAPPSEAAGVTATALSPTIIRMKWTASTDNVGVSGYRIYRMGVMVGTTSSTFYLDKGLHPNTTYAYTVAAYDTGGNVSAQSSPPAEATTLSAISIGAAKKSSTSSRIGFTGKIVTAAVGEYYYIQEPDRSAGIKIVPLDMPAETKVGDMVDGGGIPQVVDGECCLDEAVCEIKGTAVSEPISLSNSAIGGGSFGLQDAVSGWRWVHPTGKPAEHLWLPAQGLSTIGLLVRTCGEVTHVNADLRFFYIDDGSDLDDGLGSPTMRGLRVWAPNLNPGELPSVGQFVSVTGISSCFKPGGDLLRLIHVRSRNDIMVMH